MFLSECDSTNTQLKRLLAAGEAPDYIYAGYQTAGRGQTGNGWESEQGKNLTCSLLVESQKSKVESLFDLNVTVSVAVHRTVTGYRLPVTGDGVTIKWPNDIYYGDRKLAGILIENAIVGGELKYAIAGVGLNVNQTEFQSDAPNPVSLRQITGLEYDIHELMQCLYDEVQRAMKEDVWDYYRAHLYRREGYWPFVEREVNAEPTMNADRQAAGQFLARIEDVLPTGEIILEDEQGKERKYHFKQIRYVI